ncbi:MAG: DUF1223 domain-containing protein [Planctomycetota bacterium]
MFRLYTHSTVLAAAIAFIGVVDAGRSQAEGVAVVELFTSQGCSSCPPADENLIQLDRYARENGKPIYVLSFHVDYWNRLGWKDPYSETKYSARQSEYARLWETTRVYTPQMIVSGVDEFVGSSREKTIEAIKSALSKQASVVVSLEAERSSQESKSIKVEFNAQNADEGDLINFAVVDSPAANDVARGENRGRTLKHVNVVRSFARQRLSTETKGAIELEFPEDLETSTAAVIAYVQSNDGEIRGVERLDWARVVR